MSIQLLPEITFKVNLARLTQEKIGPNTNQQSVTLLHPDQYCNAGNVDAARTATTVRDLQKISWLPGLLASENINQIDDVTFTAYGAKAIYLRDTYAAGYCDEDNAWLTVV
jgi:hypothetical protein